MFERILMAGSTFPEPILTRLQKSTGKLISMPTLEEATGLLKQNEAFDLIFADCQGAFSIINELLAAARISGNMVIGLIDGADTTRRAQLEETGILDIHPLPSSEESTARLLRNAYSYLKLNSEVQYYRGLFAPTEELIGRSDAMRKILASVQKYATEKKPVLVCGPRGSGKDMIAQLLHRVSPNAHGPLLTVDCGGVPEGIQETQIFGRKTGTSTSFRRQRVPYIPLASGGTLVINNFDAMPASLQARLLTHLQKIDSSDCSGLSVRIIYTSCKGVEHFDQPDVMNPKLKERLEVITLPPLRERGGDILLLAEYFIRQFSAETNRNIALDVSAREALQNYTWPGEVEELKCFVQRALMITTGDKIDAWALAFPGSAPCTPPPWAPAQSVAVAESSGAKVQHSADSITVKIGTKLADVEQQLMLRTVEMMNGNRTQAAAMLGISVRTLYTRLLEAPQSTDAKSESI